MKLVRLCLITSVGGALEFFDFTIFMLFSRYIAAAFFPENDPFAGTMSVALLFLTGYIARPVGGMIAGHFGDIYGRKKLFMITISAMSIVTLGIGLLPTYEYWGQLSLWLLVAFRLIQGLAVGGELPGSTTFAAEHVEPARRGLVTGIIIAAVTFGNVLGASLGWLLNSVLSSDELYLWGWRVPFILGGVLGLLGLIVRRKLVETPIYLKQCDHDRIPVWTLLRTSWKEAFSGVVYASVTATIVSLFLYLPTYFGLSQVGTGASSFQITTLGFLLYSFLTIPFAWLSDVIGRRRQMMLGCAALIPACLVSFLLVEFKGGEAIGILIILVAVTGAIINGAYEAAIIELFPTSIRYSGVAFSHNLGFVLFGGLTPVVLTGAAQHGVTLAPVLILIPVSLVLLCVCWRMPCRSSQSLERL